MCSKISLKHRPFIRMFLSKKIFFLLCVFSLVLAIYGYFYIQCYTRNYLGSVQMVSRLGDVHEGFRKFKKNENRLPVCMDEVVLASYNKNLSLEGNIDIISDLPYRCVTLRNMYYYVGGDVKRKVLVTLYKPYRTRLWPFGEMKTMVMLEEGTICTISPSEIIVE